MIRVLVVDDHEIVREGLSSLLSASDAVEVVGQAPDALRAIQLVSDLDPDVMLLDLRVPGGSGLAVLSELQKRSSRCRAIILTTFDDSEALVEAVRKGTAGFLLKDAPLSQLLSAIERVHGGERVFRTDCWREIAESREGRELWSASESDPDSWSLTRREEEVLEMLSSGLSNRQIAQALDLVEGTVKNHVSVVLRKLGVRSRTAAALMVTRSGASRDGDLFGRKG